LKPKLFLLNVYIIFLIFQVGGHTRLLLLNQSTVIKPLNLRELDFYQNIPQDILKFVPKYKGKIPTVSPPASKTDHTFKYQLSILSKRFICSFVSN